MCADGTLIDRVATAPIPRPGICCGAMPSSSTPQVRAQLIRGPRLSISIRCRWDDVGAGGIEVGCEVQTGTGRERETLESRVYGIHTRELQGSRQLANRWPVSHRLVGEIGESGDAGASRDST